MPGHERLEVERVVDQNHIFAVVEKIVPLDETSPTTFRTKHRCVAEA